MKLRIPALFCFCMLIPVATPAATDRLVLISPHPDGVQNEFETAFKSHYSRLTGREVVLEWLDVGGGTSSILRYVKSEFRRAPDGIGIDVFFGGGMDPFMEIADMGLCSAHRLPEALLDRLPRRIGGIPLYDPDYRWYGATLAGFGIVYNPGRSRPCEPAGPADLGRPWRSEAVFVGRFGRSQKQRQCTHGL